MKVANLAFIGAILTATAEAGNNKNKNNNKLRQAPKKKPSGNVSDMFKSNRQGKTPNSRNVNKRKPSNRKPNKQPTGNKPSGNNPSDDLVIDDDSETPLPTYIPT